LSLVGAPVIGSKVLSATPDGVNHLTSLRRAKLSYCLSGTLRMRLIGSIDLL